MTDELLELESEEPQEQAGEPDTLPLLLETALGLSQLVVILVGVITTVLSLIVGSTWLAAAMRGGAAIVILGLIFWALNWLIARGMIEATVAETRAKMEAEAEGSEDKREQTMERAA